MANYHIESGLQNVREVVMRRDIKQLRKQNKIVRTFLEVDE